MWQYLTVARPRGHSGHRPAAPRTPNAPIGAFPARRRAPLMALVAVVLGAIGTLCGCGLAPPSRSPLARQLDQRLSEEDVQQVQRDPFPSASQVGL